MKKIISILLSVLMILGCLAVPAFAADRDGMTVSSAINVSFGQKYFCYWSTTSASRNCYNKVVLPSNGILVVNASKPFDDEGEFGSVKLRLSDYYGDTVWNHTSDRAKNDGRDYYRYHIGLRAGTYYMNIMPNFYVESGVIDFSYSFSFVPTENCEFEDNENMSDATPMKLGEAYHGWFGTREYSNNEKDYLSFNATKGKTYTIYFYEAFIATHSAITKIYSPDGKEHYTYFKNAAENGLACMEYTAEVSGRHIIGFYNYSSEPLYYILGVSEAGKALDMSKLAKLPELPVIDHTAPSSGRGGTMHANAIPVVFDKNHSSYWTSLSDHLNCFNRVVLPERGELTFRIDKIYDSEGEVGSVTTYIYNDRGELMWEHSSYKAKNDARDFYTYTVGLDKGTYYVNFTPDFYVEEGIFDFNYTFTFKADPYCEIEANNSFLDATKLEFGHFCNAAYGSNNSGSDDRDYFWFPVKKGGKYTVSIKNFGKLDATSVIISCTDEYGEEHYTYFEDKFDSEYNNCMTFKPEKSGKIYIYMYNYSQEPVKFAIKATADYEPVTVVSGDVNQDGNVTAEDARLALRASVGLEKYKSGSKQFTLADVDKNKKITANDARLILRASVGLEKLK